MSQWRPDPELAAAVSHALHAFQRRWRTAMAMDLSSEAGRQDLTAFAYALKDIPVSAIPTAVLEWLAHNELPPGPASFARTAREVAAKFAGPAADIQPGQQLPAIQTGWNETHAEKLHARAKAKLGSHALAARVWVHVLRTAAHPTTEAAFRRGDIPFDVWDDAVEAVRREITIAAARRGDIDAQALCDREDWTWHEDAPVAPDYPVTEQSA